MKETESFPFSFKAVTDLFFRFSAVDDEHNIINGYADKTQNQQTNQKEAIKGLP